MEGLYLKFSIYIFKYYYYIQAQIVLEYHFWLLLLSEIYQNISALSTIQAKPAFQKDVLKFICRQSLKLYSTINAITCG